MPLRPDIAATTPVGIRDFTPGEAAELYRLEAAITSCFEARGYQRVVTPTFELMEIFERGLGPEGAARVLRFVDPQNGEVLCLRSDITPQIARLVAGPMSGAALPARLCYFGRVYRLRQHSEFRRREVVQAGVELIGAPGPDADVEILSLCSEALHAAGQTDHVLSIGHTQVIDAVFAGLDVTRDEADKLKALLRRKAPTGVDTVNMLSQLYGDPVEVLERARAVLARAVPAVEAPLDRLAAVLDGLTANGVAERCLLDLGEMLGFGYYTGIVFHAYVPGVGHAVASGGRYDELVGRYGRDLPACGFAIDEEGVGG